VSAGAVTAGRSAAGAHAVLCTFGSAGDVRPYLAIGRALAARGMRVALATSGIHAEAAREAGLGFHAVRPDVSTLVGKPLAYFMDARRGSERVVRELVAPHVQDSYADTEAAVRGADLVVSHPLTFAVPLLGEALGLRWASTALAPVSIASAHDPMVPPSWPWYVRTLGWGPRFHDAVLALGRAATAPWVAEVTRLRRRLGLPPGAHPLWQGQHSPHLALALFSSRFMAPQPDWPPAARVTGFPFLDDDAPIGDDVRAFLDAGPAPLVFTLGTSAVHDARDFFDVAATAAARLGRRALLLVGRESGWTPRGALPDGVLAVPYAPHARVFPRAAAIVHQAGIGTTAEALRAGRPAIVVPFSHDQFDNAARATRLGVARTLHRRAWRAGPVVEALAALLGDAAAAARAAEVGTAVRAERGVEGAADALVELLGRDLPRRG
jgi:rhamnosyltransferase subunit B